MHMNVSKTLLALMLGLITLPVFADSFKEGTDYTVIAKEPSAEAEVLEFFSYGCGHCYSFEPFFNAVKSAVGETAKVGYVPVDFGSGFWTPAQDLFLVMEALGKREELHEAAFRFIHTERNPITAINAKRFLAMHGVDEETYDKARSTMGTMLNEKRYDKLVRHFQIQGTPTVIVNGKYRVENVALESPAKLAELVKFLLTNP